MKKIIILYIALVCISNFDIFADNTKSPTVRDVLEGIKASESAFFRSDSFLVRCQRIKCEEITKSRYSGGYTNVEFITIKKDSKWLTSKRFTQIGKEDKDGHNIVDGVWTPLEPDSYVIKDHIALSWWQHSSSAAVDRFGDGISKNMLQNSDYFRHIGWDLARHLVESEEGDYNSIRKEEWLKDDLEHPFLPEYLEKNLSRYSILSQQEDVDGFPCWVVEYPGMDKLWIDAEHGYVVRKRIYHWEPGKPRKFAIHNSDFREVKPRIWLPYKQVVDKYASIKSEDEKIWDKVASRLYYQLEEILINDVSDEVFDIKPPVGTQIVDSVRDIIYTIYDENKDPFEDPIKQGIGELKKQERMMMWRFIGVVVFNICIIIVVWLYVRGKERQNRENKKKGDDKTKK